MNSPLTATNNICPSCGAQLEDNLRYVKCNYCGYTAQKPTSRTTANDDDDEEEEEEETIQESEIAKCVLFKINEEDCKTALREWLATADGESRSKDATFFGLDRQFYPLYVFKGSYTGTYDTYTNYMGGQGDLISENNAIDGNFFEIVMLNGEDSALILENQIFENIDPAVFDSFKLRKEPNDLMDFDGPSPQEHWKSPTKEYLELKITKKLAQSTNAIPELSLQYKLDCAELIYYPIWKIRYKNFGGLMPVYIDGITGKVCAKELPSKFLQRTTSNGSFKEGSSWGITRVFPLVWIGYFFVRLLLSEQMGYTIFDLTKTKADNLFLSQILGIWWLARGVVIFFASWFLGNFIYPIFNTKKTP